MLEFKELKKHADLLEICGKCGDCASAGTQITTAKRHVDNPCPVKTVLGFEAYDARGRILVLKNLLNNKLKIDGSIVKWAYSCTGCASCSETCLAIEGGINTPLLMESLRIDLVRQGKVLEKHEKILLSIKKNANPYEEPVESRFDFLKEKKIARDSDTVLYIGCTLAYRQPDIALASIQLLENLGVEFSLLQDETCCGSILKRYGREKEFKALAESNIKKLMDKKVKKVIFPCAGCYRTYKKDYAELNNTSIQFYHLTEFLDQYLKDNSHGFKMPKHVKITFHDPCHLGRHCGVYESPRTLIKNIQNSTFVEFNALRNYSHCCGAGGGVKSSEPDLAVKMAKNRLQEANEKSIEMLVSACPFCEKNLKDGLDEEFDGLRVLDISELLLLSFKKDMSSQIIVQEDSIKSEIGQKYIKFLSKYPEIFADLTPSSIMDFAIYKSIEDLEEEAPPVFNFNVLRTNDGIEIKTGGADEPDLELALSITAVEKLIQNKTKNEYVEQFGLFYNEPDEDEGWIDFILHKRTKTLIKMGYGKFAEEAGILEDEDSA